MANKTRPKQVVIRMKEDEFETLQKKIRKSKTNQQEYLLKSVLEKEIISLEGLKEVSIELRRQGVNLNNLVKDLKTKGFIDYKNALPNALKEFEDTWQSLRQLIQKAL